MIRILISSMLPIVLAWAAVISCIGQDLKAVLSDIDRRSGGTLGVYALDVETGREVGLREKQFFPMASVYKVPIGIVYLNHVFLRKLNLDDSVTITKDMLSPEFSPLLQRWKREGDFTLTQRELLRQMVSFSDNSACDILLKLVGGPKEITRYFANAGLVGFSVNRTEREMGRDYFLYASPALKSYKGLEVDSVLSALTEQQHRLIAKKYLEDRKDVASPEGIGQLLSRLHKRSLPGFTDYQLILNMMIDTPTGPGRIKSSLPQDAILAHKTGGHRTMAGINIASNDVGIVTLPGGQHIILAIFLKGSTLDAQGRDQIIADVTSAVIKSWAKR